MRHMHARALAGAGLLLACLGAAPLPAAQPLEPAAALERSEAAIGRATGDHRLTGADGLPPFPRLLLSGGIAFVAWQIIRSRRDSFGRFLAFGIATMVCLQAVINIAVATVSVPTKGLSLPLVSAGGSGLVIACGALGLLASVCRFEHAEDRLPDPAARPDNHRVGESDWQAWTVAG